VVRTCPTYCQKLAICSPLSLLKNIYLARESDTWLCRKLRQAGADLGPPRQVSSNPGLADLDAEFEQFAMDAGAVCAENSGSAILVMKATETRSRCYGVEVLDRPM
jgi:hypothetical protein